MPSAAAMACLDHMVAEYYHKAMRESSAMDGPAQALMGHVQHAVSGLWGNHARIACFGSRATGLACATSDVDLVVTGVPGIDPATVPQLWRHAPVTVDDQCAALEDLQPLILSLPGVLSATINRAAVPVLAITADVRILQRLQPSSAAQDGAAHGGAHDGGNCTSAATGADAPTTAPATAPATALLHLDISIHSERHRGLLAAQHVRWLHALLPPLAPLVVMLKALLHRHGLKSTFTGGLSSYALVILVARFLMDRPRLRCRLWAPTTAPAEKGSISHAEMAAAEAEARAALGAALRAAAHRASSWADCPADVERTRRIGQPAPTADETRATSDDETPVTTPVATPEATPDAAALSDATGAVTGAGATQCSAEGTEDSAGAHDGAHTGAGAGALSRAPASLGQLFVEVLAFYGQIFEPSSHALVGLTGAGVPPPPGYGFATRHELAPMLSMLNNGFGGFGVSPQPDPFAMEPLVVLDPVDPSNNVGKSCYRVAAVQRLCADTARATLALAEDSARCPQKVPSATLAEAILGVPPSQMA